MNWPVGQHHRAFECSPAKRSAREQAIDKPAPNRTNYFVEGCRVGRLVSRDLQDVKKEGPLSVAGTAAPPTHSRESGNCWDGDGSAARALMVARGHNRTVLW